MDFASRLLQLCKKLSTEITHPCSLLHITSLISPVFALFAGSSLKDRLAETNNRPSGFDYLRVGLSVGVLAYHTPRTANSWLTPMGFALVPMFFAISGFLVAGSLDRSRTMVTFLGMRAIRIVPALAGEVFLSALILGPLFTTETLAGYFSAKEFYLYFLNIVGDVHYSLPGVFKDNKYPYVNGQLWTVPYELISYLVLWGMAVFGIYKRRLLLLFILVAYYAAQIGNTVVRGTAYVDGFPTGINLVMAFIAGLVIYKYRERIALSKGLFVIAATLTLLCVYTQGGARFAALPAAYVAIYFGMLNPTRNQFIQSGDYSYGIYLYGYPIQQAFIAANPIFQIWYYNLLGGLVCTLAVAACSWFLIEKPSLDQRYRLKIVEEHWCRLRKRVIESVPPGFRARFRFNDVAANPD